MHDEELRLFTTLYRHVSADLNHLQTHYPESRYTDYLNGLLSRCHAHLHADSGFTFRQAVRFMLQGYPALLRKEKGLIFLSTGIFLLACIFAYLSVIVDTPWAAALLPPETREMLIESITRLEDEGPIIPVGAQPFFASFIVTNNIQVTFLAFAGGLFCGLGTLYILAVNGAMLGSYAAFFTSRGAAVSFWALILPHGIIELTAIFFAGAAGFALGRALLMPGDYSRKDSLNIGGRTAALMLLGTAPLLVIAALIEGFFTPASLPDPAKLAFAGATALLLCLYLITRPLKKKRRARF